MSDDNSSTKKKIPRRRAAERLGICVRTLMRWERDPKLNLPKPDDVNGRKYFDDEEFSAWQNRRAQKVA
jgi:hypothetical protein